MTALAGGPADETQVLPVRPAAESTSAEVPAPAPGMALLGQQQGSGYVVPPALVRRGDGQVLQLTPLLYAVLEAIDGERDVSAIARVASNTAGRTIVDDDVRTLLERTLRPMGLVLRPDGTTPPLARANPLLALRPRFVVSKPTLTRRITAPFALLFNPVLVTVVTIAFAVVAYWVLFDKGLASAAYEAFSRPGLLLAVFVITVVSAGFHEFGHAAALRRGGGTPGAMGAGLYLIWPAFYTDVTDSYALSRRARIRVDLGGLYFNAIVALVMFGIWEATRWDGLLLVIAAQILQMVRQLPPLVRFDGYHLLADVTGVPDLFHRIGPTMRSFLPRRWRHAESRVLRPWVRVVVTAWVLLVVPLLVISLALTVVALPRILGTTAHSVSAQWTTFMADARRSDVAGAAVKALAIVALVVPVGGLLLLLARSARSYGVRTWRATRGRPGRRAVAVVAAAGILAALVYAWWPHGNYRPIQRWERGTVLDAVPAVLTAGLQPGAERSAQTIWADDGSPRPTPDHPVLAMVLTPRSGHGPTWVFPFNKPAPPGPGGNQAMAIVTRNGGTAYDVSFALVYATHDIVLNRNEAYAFASCHACRAVAVSFQIVLVVGHAHVIAPQNIAAAVSYRCPACVTEAIAQQLVVSLPHQPTAQQRRALAAVWFEMMLFEHRVRHMTFSEIQHRLTIYERRILAIVRPDLLTTPSSPSPSPSGLVDSTSTATGSPTPASSAAAPASSDAGTPTATPTTPASASPSGTDATASPSPTATGSTTTAP